MAATTLSNAPSRPRFIDAPAPACPLCDDGGTRTMFFPAVAQAYEGCPPWPEHVKFYCPLCHYIWSDRLAGLDLASYGDLYVTANTSAQRRPNERMPASPLLLEHLLGASNGRRFLDYGVGYNGGYIEAVRATGIDLLGCDISSAVTYGKSVLRLPDQWARLCEESFDGIFSQDVIEHFNNPVEDHRRLASLLRPGGLILSSTPVLEKVWDGREPIRETTWLLTPWHVSLHSSTAMRLIADRAGLEFVDTIPVPTDTRWAFLLRRPGGAAFDSAARRESELNDLRGKLRALSLDLPLADRACGSSNHSRGGRV